MSLSRRRFLRLGLAASAVTLVELPCARADVTAHFVTRRDGRFDPIHAYVHDIDDSYNRRSLLGQAVQVLHTRFRDSNVVRNAYQIPTGEFIDGNAWAASNVAAAGLTSKQLLAFQLMVLRLPDSAQEPDDEGPPFPAIHIHPYFAQDDSYAKAPVNVVQCKYVGPSQYRRTGEFRVYVNLNHLGGGGPRSDPFVWASVLAHEMLHNLGHKHRPGEYVDGRQMNAFHRAVYCNGGYRPGQTVPGFG